MKHYKKRALEAISPDIDFVGKLEEYADEKIKKYKHTQHII